MEKSFYQSTQDQAIEEFEKRLLSPSLIPHAGFDSYIKAMNPSLAELTELNLGYLDDKELAAEIDTLNSFLREEREMYDRSSHFYNILDAAQQRIRHLSGRLARAEGREVFAQQENTQILGRLHLPVPQDQGYSTRRSLIDTSHVTLNDVLTHPGGGTPLPFGEAPMERPWDLLGNDGDVTPPTVTRPWDGRGGFAASGMEVRVPPRESFVSSTEPTDVASKLNAAVSSASFIPADGAPIETVAVGETLGRDFQGDHEYAVINLPEVVKLETPSGTIASAGFGVTWSDFSKQVNLHASVLTRIGVLVDRLCFKLGVQRDEKMSALANKILRYPEVSNQLLLKCFEAANPDMLGASTESLNQLYRDWLELVDVVDPRPSRNSEG